MVNVNGQDQRFGDIAVNLGLMNQEKLDRALVVQKMIISRTKVHMPIGKVLKEMGVITQEQIETVLNTQKALNSDPAQNDPGDLPECAPNGEGTVQGICLILSKDRLSASLCPSGDAPGGLSLEAVKRFLADRKVIFGLVEDDVLSQYLMQDPLPQEPFVVAQGIPPEPGRPSEVIYHFDTDPMRIGTLTADGTMDWRNRGEIPHVAVGDLLVEKTPGDPGAPGTGICGGEIAPPRIREPQIKCGKGTERSEDGRRIVAKINGTPKLGSDGKVTVFGMLPIDGDIGVETGHINFDGYIEASGGVTSGYSVKGRGLRIAGIQDADIEVDEDLNCLGGIYGSTIIVGGNLKAGHIHNCTIKVLGDLVVKKEIYDSTIETNGRCLIGEGKIIASRIDAKKGVHAKTVGSVASSPCSLTVGIDRKYQKDMALYEEELGELKRQKKDVEKSGPDIRERLESVVKQLGTLTQEQDNFMVQKRQFEQQLCGEGPNPVKDDEERSMLEEMIGELVEKNESMEAQIADLMEKEDRLGNQLSCFEKSLVTLDEHIEKTKENISLLDTTLKVDPGIPVVKVSGTIYAKTHITARHKEMLLAENMHNVRIAESLSELAGHKYQIKISNLR